MKRHIATAQRHVGRCMETQLALPSVVLLIFMFVFATAALADGPLPWQNTGSGNWGGVRKDLADHGVTFMAIEEVAIQYNTTGGIDTGVKLHNRFVGELNFQLEPLLGLRGSELMVSGASNLGGNINNDVGSIIGPTTIYRTNAFRLFELYWGQYFIDKQVFLKIGRQDVGDNFGSSPLLLDYMSAGYNSNLGAVFINQPVTTFTYPIATWGARVLIAPEDEDYNLKLAAYNGWPRTLDDADKHGAYFSLNLDESTFLLGEFEYMVNQDPGDQGLLGRYMITFMYDTGSFERLDQPGKEKEGNFGLYLLFDQMIFRESVPDHPPDNSANWKVGWHRKRLPTDQGLYIWGGVNTNPDKDINLVPWWVSGGIHYKGLIPGRPADRTGIGAYHGFSSSKTDLDDETQIEAFHRFQFTPWLVAGPHIQYYVNPGGSKDNDNALVLGLRLSAEF